MTQCFEIPDIRPLAEQVLGMAYEEMHCWGLVRFLFHEGWGIDIESDPQEAAKAISEYWFQDDPQDPLLLVRPWDLVIMRSTHLWSTHVGVVIDTTTFIHTRPRTGVVLESLSRWRRYLLQIARLQRLL